MNPRDVMLKKLQDLAVKAKPFKKQKRWLPEDPSAAFICCIGAGPWRYPRRRKIQYEALQQLAGRDLAVLDGTEKWFPLDWQNEMLAALVSSVKRMGRDHWHSMPSMAKLVDTLRKISPTMARPNFYHACGRPHGTKVLSLYLRDFIGVECFPIDRHVKRALIDHRLPLNEMALLELCHEANVDPIPIARMLIDGKLDGGNPDWSLWPRIPAAEMPGNKSGTTVIKSGFEFFDKMPGGFKNGEIVVIAGHSRGPRTILKEGRDS